MQYDLHASVASLQWTVNSYGISFAATISCFALTARAPEGAASPEAVDALVDA